MILTRFQSLSLAQAHAGPNREFHVAHPQWSHLWRGAFTHSFPMKEEDWLKTNDWSALQTSLDIATTYAAGHVDKKLGERWRKVVAVEGLQQPYYDGYFAVVFQDKSQQIYHMRLQSPPAPTSFWGKAMCFLEQLTYAVSMEPREGRKKAKYFDVAWLAFSAVSQEAAAAAASGSGSQAV